MTVTSKKTSNKLNCQSVAMDTTLQNVSGKILAFKRTNIIFFYVNLWV